MTLTVFITCILGAMAAIPTGIWAASSKFVPGSHHVYGFIGALLFVAAMLACAGSVENPTVAFVLAVPCVFCMALSIFRQPSYGA